MQSDSRLRVAIIGTGRRSEYLYGPIINALSEQVELVGVWGRSRESAQRVGASLAIPWFTDMDELMRATAPDLGIVSVNYHANGEVGLMAVESGLHVLLETPIAHRLSDADAIMRAATQRNRKIEVAEQFHRRPYEQIKLALLATGLFGQVYSSFNDFAGHGYHGVSVMRSYLGFDAVPVRVHGITREFQLTEHWSRLTGRREPRNETQEHGMIEFSDGRIGIFHWTNIGYDTPLRWWRSSRFLAEKGMGITVGVGLDVDERLSLLAPGAEAPHFITLERRWERVDGGSLHSMVAHTGVNDMPIVRWDNPFRPVRQGHGPQWHDDEIGVAACLLSLVNAINDDTEPSYGPQQARLDQELILAIRQASAQGKPVELPMDPDQQEI